MSTRPDVNIVAGQWLRTRKPPSVERYTITTGTAMQQPNEWTLKETAHYNGVTIRTIQRWIHHGHLAARLEPNPHGRPTRYVNAKDGAAIGGRMRRHAETTRYR